ncbi:MAG: undecaprenyl-diphosphate phosphatase [Nanoarchaeota archaeon]|mgnify:FL=1
MIEWISALILAVVQGITEFFPVSSSGHLVLFEKILNYSGGLLLEVALHFGTLMAVFVYFGNDIVNILRDLFSGKFKCENGRLGVLLIVASIPAGAVGFFVKDFFDSLAGNLFVLGFGWAVTSLVLFIGSMNFERRREIGKLGFGNAFLIGIAQVFSLVPGVSRSGATISSGLVLGLNEKNAVKFSYLLSIPVIIGANLVSIGNRTLPLEFLGGTLLSFFIGLIFINISFRYVLTNRNNLRWFGAYTLLLAVAVLFNAIFVGM